MSALDGLKDQFFKFRRKKYALPLGLVLTAVVCSLLLAYSYTICFGYLIVALLAYYIPYYFGLKSKKKLAVFGLVLLIVISVPFGVKLATDYKDAGNDTLSSPDGVLFDGKVTPFQANNQAVHHFSVVVRDPAITSVWVNIADQWAASPIVNKSLSTVTNVSGGREFALDLTLQNNSVYAYQFLAENGTKWVSTDASFGPIDVSDSDLYTHMIELALYTTMIMVGLLFYLLIALNWMTERSRKKAEELQQQREGQEGRGKGEKTEKVTEKEGKEEKLVCSECGAEVPASAKECPQCGEKFDDEDGGFICTECGANVKETDKKCWNCGKEFEN